MRQDPASPSEPPPPAAPSRRASNGMLALRVALGVIWSINLIYIFDPANLYWSGFQSSAASYAGETLGGGGFATFVAANPSIFAIVIAAVTVYLAIAFLLGLTTRLACVVGFGFTFALFVTQWAQISTFPGSTDVGTQPLYLAMFVALFIGFEAPRLSIDGLFADWSARRARSTRSESPAPA
jgi:uncharacterized membrane protein YphA (DoxX/SURF4 family)